MVARIEALRRTVREHNHLRGGGAQLHGDPSSRAPRLQYAVLRPSQRDPGRNRHHHRIGRARDVAREALVESQPASGVRRGEMKL